MAEKKETPGSYSTIVRNDMVTNPAGYWQINDKQLTTWQTIGTLA